MSWLYSQALVEAFSPATSLDGEPSAQLNVMPTPHKFWRKDKMIEPSDHSRFGLTCAVLTAGRGEGVLMSFLEAFPVRTSAPPAAESGFPAPEAGFGEKWRELLARYDHASFSWKTPQSSQSEGSELSSVTWTKWGSTRSGGSYLPPTAMPRTFANGCGFWPTPVASDIGTRRRRYAQGGMPLSLAANLYPTPTAGSKQAGGSLSEWGGSGSRKKFKAMISHEDLYGPLNPTWVEWLMGWPIGWTELKPLEMGRFHEWQRQHSIYCEG